jgi:hypothetical protein
MTLTTHLPLALRLRISTGIYTPLKCYVDTFHMTKKMEKMCIKFCQKLGKTCIETYNMLKMAFKEDSISRTQVFERCRCFREGRTPVEDDKHPG